MLILALDTTSEKGGVGIFRDVERLVSVVNQGPASRYSITLFEMVEQALAEARVELREIGLYAVANGPGSFTGIRVGLAAARAWGKAFDRKVCGVSMLEAMVRKQSQGAGDWGLGGRNTGVGTRGPGLGETSTNIPRPSESQESLPSPRREGTRGTAAGEGLLLSQRGAGPDWYFPILDARRGEFFLGCFRRIPSEQQGEERPEYEPADGGWVLKPDRLRTFIEERVISGASATYLVRADDHAAANLRASLPAGLDWQAVEGALLDSIADLARKEEKASGPCLDANLDAYYIRRPDAEINWKD